MKVINYEVVDGRHNFDIVDDYGTKHYHTNRVGEGLWRDGRQVTGTCQFRITQKTESGIRRYIKRWFED